MSFDAGAVAYEQNAMHTKLATVKYPITALALFRAPLTSHALLRLESICVAGMPEPGRFEGLQPDAE